MKKLLAVVLSAIALYLAACVSTPVVVTPAQQTIANAVEDAISIGLVPVLTKNESYVPAVQGIAAALGVFSGSTLTPADVDAFLAKTTLSPEDAKTVAGLVNAAWAAYAKHYAQQLGASIRPDVKLFLGAVADGITAACAAVPKG